MPAAVPADVRIWPSSTYSTSGSTSMSGKRFANLSVYRQWVVARRPSSRPAWASANAPEHSLINRTPRRWARRNAFSIASGGAIVSSPDHAGTTIVSARSSADSGKAPSMTNPWFVLTLRPSGDTRISSYGHGSTISGRASPNTSQITASSNGATPWVMSAATTCGDLTEPWRRVVVLFEGTDAVWQKSSGYVHLCHWSVAGP